MSMMRDRWWRAPATLCGGLALSLMPLVVSAAEPEKLPLPNDPPAAVKPPQTKAVHLEEAIRWALEQQPNIAAARASLAAAQSGQMALENLRAIPLLPGSHELPIRRKQAGLGVCAAEAALKLAEQETVYAVTRTYYSVLFAQAQENVAREAIELLQKTRAKVEEALKGKNPNIKKSDLKRLDVYIAMGQTRQEEAAQGTQRALAALREAIGIGPECCLAITDSQFPPVRDGLCKGDLIQLALAHRPDLRRAQLFAEIVYLEADAQGKACGPAVRTFAAGADIHAKPAPQGIANGEYRPGALNPEMPTLLVGKKCDRVQRATEFGVHATSLVEKTRGLVVLEVEDAFFRWSETSSNVRRLAGVSAQADEVAKEAQDALTDVGNAEDAVRTQVLAAQVKAQYNEAVFHHALVLATIERATGAAFCLHPAMAAPAK
ncbi:MAG: TolC family protein [Gemmataceae bacterium]|nr:TolC family protein [Gemmataceae bacterium]